MEQVNIVDFIFGCAWGALIYAGLRGDLKSKAKAPK